MYYLGNNTKKLDKTIKILYYFTNKHYKGRFLKLKEIADIRTGLVLSVGADEPFDRVKPTVNQY